MIHHPAMKKTQKLNVFITKGGFSDHYSAHMIISQTNWYCNKYYQVELGAYVQASQINDPKNSNRPRTPDGIYLYPMPNFQGVHHIMDLRTVQLVTIPKVVEIPIIDFVIKAVEKWRRSIDLST